MFFFSFILFYLNPIGLYSDEIAYATSAFQLIIFIVDKFSHIFDLLPSLNKIPLKYIYQILSLIGWLIILCIIFFIKKINRYRFRITSVAAILIFFRMLTFLLGYSTDVHPPLNYFGPNLFCSLLGLTEIGFKCSIALTFTIFYVFIMVRLNLDIPKKILILILIVSTKDLSHWSTYFEQANYSYMAFILFLVEISFFKPNPKNLALMVSFSVFFRYVNILLVLPTLIYSFLYSARHQKGLKRILESVLENSIPMILLLPPLYQIIFTGTPTTSSLDNFSSTNSELFNFDLLKFSFISFNSSYFIIIFFIISTFKNKDLKIFFNIIVITFLYLLLNNSANDIDKLELKYHFELIGFIIGFGLIYIVKNCSSYLFNFTLLIFILFINTFNNSQNKKYLYKSDYDSDVIYDFIIKNNSIDKIYIHDYPINNKFMFVLKGFNKTNIDKYMVNHNAYHSNKNSNWYTLDPQTINNLESIDYLVVGRINGKGDLKNKTNELIQNFKWISIISVLDFQKDQIPLILKRQ